MSGLVEIAEWWDEWPGNHVLTGATHITVVPAKAGIQEILREKIGPATEGSGFRLSPERRVYARTGGKVDNR